MKFAERVLCIMYALGIYFAVVHRPQDVSLLFIAACLMAILYVCCMPFLLTGITLMELRERTTRARLRWHYWLMGILFGVFNGYFAYACAYRSIHRMDRIAFAENCGLALVLFVLIALARRKKDPGVFYKTMLRRCGILLTLLAMFMLFPG